jgi:hypothetical protein
MKIHKTRLKNMLYPYTMCYEEKGLFDVKRVSRNLNFCLSTIYLGSISTNTDATSYC